MFMWIRCLRVEDTWDMIMKRALDKNVMLVPGQAFLVDQVCIPALFLVTIVFPWYNKDFGASVIRTRIFGAAGVSADH